MHYKIKVIIIGEPGVGKTSLVKKFVSGKFSGDYRASIGINMFIKKILIDFNQIMKKISINLWDIAISKQRLPWVNVFLRIIPMQSICP